MFILEFLTIRYLFMCRIASCDSVKLLKVLKINIFFAILSRFPQHTRSCLI